MQEILIEWAEFKAAQARGFAVYHIEFPQDTDPQTYAYDVFGVEADRMYRSRVHEEDDVSDFAVNWLGSSPPKSTAVSSKDAVLALTPPRINNLGAQLVEVTSRLSQKRSVTIVSHDFSEPCTWWQNSTQVLNEELSYNIAGYWQASHALWVNAEHPKLFADEQLDIAAWAGAGYPGTLDPYFRSWWMPDATLQFRNYYYPVIQVQPGGSGSWITADPTDASTGIGDPGYGYTVDYTNGRVYFNSQLYWDVGTKVRASYFYVEETLAGSSFEVGPPAGKTWHLTRTEVQITVGASWQDTVLFWEAGRDCWYACAL